MSDTNLYRLHDVFKQLFLNLTRGYNSSSNYDFVKIFNKEHIVLYVMYIFKYYCIITYNRFIIILIVCGNIGVELIVHASGFDTDSSM